MGRKKEIEKLEKDLHYVGAYHPGVAAKLYEMGWRKNPKPQKQHVVNIDSIANLNREVGMTQVQAALAGRFLK